MGASDGDTARDSYRLVLLPLVQAGAVMYSAVDAALRGPMADERSTLRFKLGTAWLKRGKSTFGSCGLARLISSGDILH